MPAKKTITKDIIINKSIKVLEKKGISNLNVRDIAKEIGCSTQPIYLSFPSMDDLKKELEVQCRNVYQQYINEEMKKSENLFFGYLYSYILFAKDHPRMFEYLFMYLKSSQEGKEEEMTNEIVSKIMERGGYSKETAFKFYLQSWIYAHGFATQFVTGYSTWDIDVIKDFMKDEFEALRKEYKGK